jgi:hypothetical protein
MAAEELKEVADHELSRIPGETRLVLARDIVRAAQLDAILASHEYAENIPKHSLTSWVESPDSLLGHALAIVELPSQTLQRHIKAYFFTAHREEKRLVTPRTTATILHPEKTLDECADDLTLLFDTDELETISRIMDKTRAIQYGFTPEKNAIDSCVYTAIVNSDNLVLQALATQFPRPDTATEICPSEVTLLPNFIQS